MEKSKSKISFGSEDTLQIMQTWMKSADNAGKVARLTADLSEVRLSAGNTTYVCPDVAAVRKVFESETVKGEFGDRGPVWAKAYAANKAALKAAMGQTTPRPRSSSAGTVTGTRVSKSKSLQPFIDRITKLHDDIAAFDAAQFGGTVKTDIEKACGMLSGAANQMFGAQSEINAYYADSEARQAEAEAAKVEEQIAKLLQQQKDLEAKLAEARARLTK